MTLEEQKKVAKLKAAQGEADLAEILALPAGRRFVIGVLDELSGGPLGAATADTLIRAAALRDKAILFERRIARIAPDAYRLLKAEQVGEHLLQIQLRKQED